MLRTTELVDLTTKGIPNKYRTDIWMIYSGALDLQVKVHINIHVHVYVPYMGLTTLALQRVLEYNLKYTVRCLMM